MIVIHSFLRVVSVRSACAPRKTSTIYLCTSHVPRRSYVPRRYLRVSLDVTYKNCPSTLLNRIVPLRIKAVQSSNLLTYFASEDCLIFGGLLLHSNRQEEVASELLQCMAIVHVAIAATQYDVVDK